MTPPCLACLHHPDHELQDEGETIATFCETHWQAFMRKLESMGRRYKGAIRRGMHPRMAERRLVVWMNRRATG